MKKAPGIRHHPFFRWLRVPLILMAAIAIVTGWRLWEGRSQFFVYKWSQRLAAVNTLEEARRLEETEPAVVLTLPSGEWIIAVCEHSCCSGAGYNATVIRDSAGAIHSDTTHSSCVRQGLCFALTEAGATSLADFYPALTQYRLKRH